MKTTRLSGFIVFLTVIGVLLIACDDGTYTVTFNANGATGGTAPAAVSANQGASITLSGQGSLVKTGYTFGGWNTTANGSGTTYAAGSSYTVTGNVTLYAKWEVGTYTVTFNANNAASGTAPAAMGANHNASVTLPYCGTLYRDGYSFDGWNTNADGSGTTYTSGSSYKVTGNVTLYAKWDVVDTVEGMVWINPGTFTMKGKRSYSYQGYIYWYEVEAQVTLTSGFYMGKYEVTQEQYLAVMGKNPSYYSSNPASGEVQSKRPVENVSWYDAIEFCNKLSMAEGLTPAYNGSTPVAGSTGYRLPTEAQWEYACRAGTTTKWSFGDNESELKNYAWYWDNSNNMTHEVGKKLPNAWGLYDMHGNVEEWCWDRHGEDYTGAQTDPTGASSGNTRVVRGGSIYGNDEYYTYLTTSAERDYNSPMDPFWFLGFRLLRP